MKTKKMKKYPKYIAKTWYCRAWIIVSFALTCYFMIQVNHHGTDEAIFGVVFFAAMTSQIIVMRHRWKKQNKALAMAESEK